MADLKVKKGFDEPRVRLLECDDNIAVIEYAETTEKPLRDEFLGDYLVAHVDESNEIIAMTITNVNAFIEKLIERKYYQQRARESVEEIVKNSRKLLRLLPEEILYQIRICTT